MESFWESSNSRWTRGTKMNFIGDEMLNGTSGSVVITWEQSTVSADNRRGKKSCKKAREGQSEKFTRPWSPIFDRPRLLHVNKKKEGERERKRGGERERELRRLSNYQLNSPFTDSRRYRVSPWTSFIRADIPTMLCFFVGQILLDTQRTLSVDFIIIFISPFFFPFLSFFFSITIF